MKIIFCKFLKKMSEGYDKQFYPGPIGNKIYKHISKIAWNQWIHEQTKLINENQLDMTNVKHQKIVEKNMINFLFKNHK